MMSHFGIAIGTSDDMRQIAVPNSRCYRSRDIEISGDYTSASYILGAAFVTRGRITLTNLDPGSAQGERAIIDILAELGADVRWGPERDTIHLDCTSLPSSVDAEFDLTDCPNILPTVAVIAATIPGRVRIVGGRLTQNHKSPRIEAIAAELRKVNVPVTVVADQAGFIDGLTVNGRADFEGGADFSDHDDHRIFMALSLFSLVSREPCAFGGPPDTEDSFPGFLEYLDLPCRALA